MWLNCKVIKKWQPSHFYINPPFSGLSPFSSKIFCTSPLVNQFLEGSTSPLIRGGRGGRGVPTMIRPDSICLLFFPNQKWNTLYSFCLFCNIKVIFDQIRKCNRWNSAFPDIYGISLVKIKATLFVSEIMILSTEIDFTLFLAKYANTYSERSWARITSKNFGGRPWFCKTKTLYKHFT